MRKHAFIMFGMALMVSVFTLSCNNAKSEAQDDQFKKEKMELEGKLNNTKEAINDKIDEVQEKLDNLEDQIANNMENANEELKTKWNDTKQDLQDQMKKLKDERDELNEELNKLSEATIENWEDFKKSVQNVVEDIDINM